MLTLLEKTAEGSQGRGIGLLNIFGQLFNLFGDEDI